MALRSPMYVQGFPQNLVIIPSKLQAFVLSAGVLELSRLHVRSAVEDVGISVTLNGVGIQCP